MCAVGNAPCQYYVGYDEVPNNGDHDGGKYHMCAPDAMPVIETPQGIVDCVGVANDGEEYDHGKRYQCAPKHIIVCVSPCSGVQC
jgi:hypothetical protein